LSYLRHIRAWQAQGYHVSLFFWPCPRLSWLWRAWPERVKQGGHNIPPELIRRRFAVGRDNFESKYQPVVNSWALFDNAGAEPVLLGWGENP